MSMENAVKFYSDVASDGEKMAMFADLQGKNIDEKIFNDRILPIAKKMGYDFTYQEAKQAMSESGKLSDAELENVSGGVRDIGISICDNVDIF